MTKGRAIVLGPNMRVMYKGIQYFLIEQSAHFEFVPEEERLKITQTFFIAKVEPGTLEDMSTVYEVLASEITPLMGNDFMNTSPYIAGISNFLSGANNNEAI